MLLLSLCVVDVACSAIFVSVRNGGWYGAVISVGGTCMSGVALPMRLLPSFVCLCEGCERSILRRDPMQRFCMHPANALDPLEGTKLPCHVTPVTCYVAVASMHRPRGSQHTATVTSKSFEKATIATFQHGCLATVIGSSTMQLTQAPRQAQLPASYMFVH